MWVTFLPRRNPLTGRPLPIDRSQGNVAALVNRFQIAADRDARLAAREARRVVSAPVKPGTFLDGNSVLGLSSSFDSGPDSNSTTSLPTSISTPAVVDASSIPSIPSISSASPSPTDPEVDAAASAHAPDVSTQESDPAQAPSPPPSIGQVVDQKQGGKDDKDKENASVNQSHDDHPRRRTAPKSPHASHKSPLSPSTTTKPLSHSRSKANLRPDATTSPRSTKSTPKLKPSSTGGTHSSTSERLREREPRTSASPQKHTASSLAKSKSRPQSPNDHHTPHPRPRSSVGSSRSPPVTTTAPRRPRTSTASTISNDSTPRSTSSTSRLMQGTAASRARAAATRAEAMATPTRVKARTSRDNLVTSPSSASKSLNRKASRPSLATAEKAVARAEKAVKRVERALERSGHSDSGHSAEHEPEPEILAA
ncbi:hypothetical protein A1Q1_04623 [Trichosporon asahii var. asahii CBS 2479]|uniref:Uncharacterized protein n=1 Tax=Trichosporon asahii var. asahii (strain ATCC 90039 / CBS 2479 / JCM 2466 / KCTC 7840 / NBRC 103889/ NCYC 2677 / UAMH 7654) TaxID=1186058 RepID=J5TRT2_TRIAS|nr:hypothetical protein A1Q1_04623 [Trichosporon asahii var. asahii CBS 2479]EJT52411.1 hypothetical protein A1Q1_04623 [Trichosporon asahii var. asahii CBS 2479]